MAFAPLTTTSVGSFPRPNWLAHTQRNQLTYRLEGDALKEAMDDAMALVIREQEELGLDLLTDGEMRRTTFIFHIAGQWQGVDTQNVVTKKIYRNREANRTSNSNEHARGIIPQCCAKRLAGRLTGCAT